VTVETAVRKKACEDIFQPAANIVQDVLLENVPPEQPLDAIPQFTTTVSIVTFADGK